MGYGVEVGVDLVLLEQRLGIAFGREVAAPNVVGGGTRRERHDLVVVCEHGAGDRAGRHRGRRCAGRDL
jgi:hypothetical protein